MSNDTLDNERIEQLAKQGHWDEALAIAKQHGWYERASRIAEQACRFEEAASMALQADDPYRAIHLAVLARNDELVQRAIEAMHEDEPKLRAAAASLASRGHPALSARLLLLIGDHIGAAEAFENAAMMVRAASEYLQGGDERSAAKLLERELKRNPDNDEAALMLGKLLVEHGRYEPATRVLQRIERRSKFRSQAVPLLIECYTALDLMGPKRDLEREARQNGYGRADRETTPPAAPAAEDSGSKQVLFGRYEIQSTASNRATAVVWRAIDQITEKPVALKQLRIQSPQGWEAFSKMAQDMRAVDQLHLPNVVPLVEIQQSYAAVITPWMAGGTLGEMLERQRPEPARAVEIASAMLDALGQAHRLGILHRDVRPSNVLFDEAGTPMLSDFGAAHMAVSGATRTADATGAFGYLSPEQRWGRPALPASDVYAVGVILLQMLTGQRPAGTDDWRPHPPSRFNQELTEQHDRVVLAMIARDPTKRFQQALDARKALLELRWPSDPLRGRVSSVNATDGATVTNTRTPKRFRQTGPSQGWDEWMQRPVVWLAWNEATAKLAKAYASAAQELGLVDVLRVDQDSSTVWFAVPPGRPLNQLRGLVLTEKQRSTLHRALSWLHSKGVAHGSVDADHIYWCQANVYLALEPRTWQRATPQGDLQALTSLLARPETA